MDVSKVPMSAHILTEYQAMLAWDRSVKDCKLNECKMSLFLYVKLAKNVSFIQRVLYNKLQVRYQTAHTNSPCCLTCMKEDVVFQVRLFTEPPVAYVTSVGPGTIMDVHVGSKVPGGREWLGAQLTLMGLVLQNKTWPILYNYATYVYILCFFLDDLQFYYDGNLA